MNFKIDDFLDFKILNENVIIATTKNGLGLPICRYCFDKDKTISLVTKSWEVDYHKTSNYFCFMCNKEFEWIK